MGHYPTLKFGRAGEFGDSDTKLEELNGGRSTKEVIQWAGKQLATCGHKSFFCVACRALVRVRGSPPPWSSAHRFLRRRPPLHVVCLRGADSAKVTALSVSCAAGQPKGGACRAYDYDPDKMGKAEAVQEAPAITTKPDPSAMLPGHAHGAAAQARLGATAVSSSMCTGQCAL